MVLAKVNHKCDNDGMWKKTIKDLSDAGWTQDAIERETGISQAMLSSMLNGVIKEPTWTRGEKLLALHRRVMRRLSKKAA